jgi:HlyD family secretion protein
MVKSKTSFVGRNHLLIVATVVALFLFSGWMMRRGAVPVHADKVLRQQISSFISTNGKVEPTQNFAPHASVAGSVKRVLVAEGDYVKAGQVLVELDDADARSQTAKALASLRSAESDMEATKAGGTQEEILTQRSNLEKAQAERDAAKRNLESLQRLQQSGAASPGEVQIAKGILLRTETDVQLIQSKLTKRFSAPEMAKVQASEQQARTTYQAAEDALRKLTITAPFSGIVYQLPIKTGSYVNPGDLILQMADLNTVQIRTFVDEPDLGRIAKDEKVQVTWDALPGRTWEGKLTRIPTAVTTLGTRTVGEVTCEISNPDHKLLPNINLNVSIVTAQRDGVLTVPREAVHDFDGRRVVYEIEDGKLKVQKVETGASNLTRVEILNGISEGTTIVLSAANAQPLHAGMEVKVVER